MASLRQFRFGLWFFGSLIQKHALFLFLGLATGLLGAIGLFRLLPIGLQLWAYPVNTIGVIGEFTPSTLPLFIQQKISFGLTAIGADGQVRPALASQWQIEDEGESYVFTLTRGLLWHNGQTVRAQDVNYQIKNVTFTPISDTQLKATLVDRYSPFLTVVSRPIVTTGLRGFGPMKVMSLSLKGDVIQRISLSPIDKESAIEQYRFYRTDEAALVAFKLGEIDRIMDLSSPGDLTNWKTAEVTESQKLDQIVTLFFNTSVPEFSDKRIRQALWYALPRPAQEAIRTPIHPYSWAYYDKVRLYESSEAQAKKIIDDNQLLIPDSLVISSPPNLVDTAQVIAASWTRLGIPTSVKVENSTPDTYQILLKVLLVPPDPDQYTYWHSTQESTNMAKYANVKIDKLLEDGRKELDLEKRKKIYADFQRYLLEDAPAIFLYHPTGYTVTRKPS